MLPENQHLTLTWLRHNLASRVQYAGVAQLRKEPCFEATPQALDVFFLLLNTRLALKCASCPVTVDRYRLWGAMLSML